MIQAVVDTVILVGGTLSPLGVSAFIVQAVKQHRFTFLTSRHHLSEIFHTLGYARLRRKYNITSKTRKRLVGQLAARGVLLSRLGMLRICRDPKDDYLIELALLGKADYLVTDDDDILADAALVQFPINRDIRPIRAAEFVQLLRQIQ
jgi:uncharacterized protein